MSKISVNTEIGPLRRVLICRPGEEQEMVHPDRMSDLLFDDLVWLEPMREAHALFTGSLSKLGVNMVDSRQLLVEFLSEPRHMEMALQALMSGTNSIPVSVNANEMHDSWMNLSSKEAARFLITGTFDDGALPLNQDIDPIPNFIFTRDYGCVIGSNILPASFAKSARKREGLLATLLFQHHPVFEGVKVFKIGELNGSQSLEGGDVMILREDIVCIGVSERSSASAVRTAVSQLHEAGQIHVITVIMPQDRSCMHLDTIFTQIDVDACLVFPKLIEPSLMADPSHANPAQIYCHFRDGSVKNHPTLLKALASLGLNLNPIPCGGDSSMVKARHLERVQAREQWTDGANALTVRPGVIFEYKRNERTIDALVKAGFKKVDADEFVSGEVDITESEKAVIILPCNELARGRGGSHCLSFPLVRD